MKNHLFDLSAGESLRLGEYRVTLLAIEGDEAVLEIEGPDGEVAFEPVTFSTQDTEVEDKQPALV